MIVSIIIPCYNVEEYIEECVVSAYLQTYSKIEVICIDNNSNDNTWAILNELKLKYPRLIIDRELKPGASAARNRGISLSKGQWVQFLDADDLLLPDKIRHQLLLIENQNNINFIIGNYIKRGIKGSDIEVFYPKEVSFIALLNSQLGNTCSNLFQAKYIKIIGGWDVDYRSSQEAKLMFELLKINDNIIYDNRALTIVRERKYGQISQRDPIKKWEQYILLRVEIIQYLKRVLPKVFKKNKEKLLQVLFDQLRELSKYDILLAKSFYDENFPIEHVPKNVHGKISFYGQIFRILGFYKTEKLFQIFK